MLSLISIYEWTKRDFARRKCDETLRRFYGGRGFELDVKAEGFGFLVQTGREDDDDSDDVGITAPDEGKFLFSEKIFRAICRIESVICRKSAGFIKRWRFSTSFVISRLWKTFRGGSWQRIDFWLERDESCGVEKEENDRPFQGMQQKIQLSRPFCTIPICWFSTSLFPVSGPINVWIYGRWSLPNLKHRTRRYFFNALMETAESCIAADIPLINKSRKSSREACARSSKATAKIWLRCAPSAAKRFWKTNRLVAKITEHRRKRNRFSGKRRRQILLKNLIEAGAQISRFDK